MGERGGTIVELVIVTAIAGLMLGALGESLVAAAGKYQGQAVASELAAELRAARFLALMRRERIVVTINPGAARAQAVSADRPGLVLRQYDFHGRGIILDGPPTGLAVQFYPSGRTATPTTIRLRRGELERWTLTVSLTGRVTVQ